VKFVWQISYPPVNDANLGRYLNTLKFGIKNCENGLKKTALVAKGAIFFENGLLLQ
jgi:hypothetical protein